MGNFAQQSLPLSDSVTLEVQRVNESTTDMITLPYRARIEPTTTPFTDTASWRAGNCLVQDESSDLTHPSSPTTTQVVKKFRQQPPAVPVSVNVKSQELINVMLDTTPLSDILLPEGLAPPRVLRPGNFRSSGFFMLDDNITGVLALGTFAGDHLGVVEGDLIDGLTSLKSSGATQLMVDLTNNGGGLICLAHWLHRIIVGPKNSSEPQAGLDTKARAGELAKLLVKTVVENHTDPHVLSLFNPRLWTNDDNVPFGPDADWMEPVVEETINGHLDAFSQRLGNECPVNGTSNVAPNEALFPSNKVVIVSNGRCASSCALFAITMAKEEGVKTVVVGGRQGVQQQYCGTVGGQSTDYATMANEVKNAGLQDHPLAPPALLVPATQGITWRLGFGIDDPTQPEGESSFDLLALDLLLWLALSTSAEFLALSLLERTEWQDHPADINLQLTAETLRLPFFKPSLPPPRPEIPKMIVTEPGLSQSDSRRSHNAHSKSKHQRRRHTVDTRTHVGTKNTPTQPLNVLCDETESLGAKLDDSYFHTEHSRSTGASAKSKALYTPKVASKPHAHTHARAVGSPSRRRPHFVSVSASMGNVKRAASEQSHKVCKTLSNSLTRSVVGSTAGFTQSSPIVPTITTARACYESDTAPETESYSLSSPSRNRSESSTPKRQKLALHVPLSNSSWSSSLLSLSPSASLQSASPVSSSGTPRASPSSRNSFMRMSNTLKDCPLAALRFSPMSTTSPRTSLQDQTSSVASARVSEYSTIVKNGTNSDADTDPFTFLHPYTSTKMHTHTHINTCAHTYTEPEPKPEVTLTPQMILFQTTQTISSDKSDSVFQEGKGEAAGIGEDNEAAVPVPVTVHARSPKTIALSITPPAPTAFTLKVPSPLATPTPDRIRASVNANASVAPVAQRVQRSQVVIDIDVDNADADDVDGYVFADLEDQDKQTFNAPSSHSGSEVASEFGSDGSNDVDVSGEESNLVLTLPDSGSLVDMDATRSTGNRKRNRNGKLKIPKKAMDVLELKMSEGQSLSIDEVFPFPQQAASASVSSLIYLL
ncbi:hypothetical protein D9758_003447 [Tetrapyrgos nigripes]|uniref:Tail specific protease domain-containing protein n=1 Tax=Tetrapyrgos nigripes TaxID=182062 RepID=A0A8H5GVK1_9AGAR|nr:hypothetical protein D9758_003447 [Tetrapyrgos nigripes]